jgi:hypothetical protein
MALNVEIHTGGEPLGEQQEHRVRRHLRRLEGRLVHFPEPMAILTLRRQRAPRRVTVDLRVELGPMAGELVSHQAAETPDHAVRLAVEDAERQLERRLATQRGEPTYGVPSRRLPKESRPNPYGNREPMESRDSIDVPPA